MGKINLRTTSGAFAERTKIVSDYLNDIKKYDSLSDREEKALFKKIKAGDKKAKDRLIESEQKYVFALAKRFDGKDKLMDLVQEGNYGLIEALENYDPDKGYRFLSFASWYIERNMKKYLINEGVLVRKSNNVKTSYKINKAKNKFFSENGRYPTSEELLELINKDLKNKIKDKRDVYDVKINSINKTIDGEDGILFEDSSQFTNETASVNDFIRTEEEDHNKAIVGTMLNCLKERDRKILEMCYGIGYDREYTYYETGEALGLTSERVRQICLASLKKLSDFAASSKACTA